MRKHNSSQHCTLRNISNIERISVHRIDNNVIELIFLKNTFEKAIDFNKLRQVVKDSNLYDMIS